MKFTIINTCLNEVNRIEANIKSVLSHDYNDIEYLIIDGGSTDGTVNIIKEYAGKDDRIRWISEPDNGGVDALNKGLKMATGDLIGVLYGDDEFCEGALKAVADAYEAHPDYDIFHGDLIKIQDGNPIFRLTPSDDVDKHVWHEVPINATATYYSKRAFDKVGYFDADLPLAADFEMILRLYLNKFKFFYIKKALIKMAYGGDSDVNYIEGYKQVYKVQINKGYPRYKALFWFVYKVVKSSVKNILRKLGLHSLIKLHPKFHSIRQENR